MKITCVRTAIAKPASAVFTPYLAGFYLFMMDGASRGFSREVVVTGVVINVLCNIAPLCFVLFMKGAARIADVHISSQNERNPFYAFLLVVCVLAGAILYLLGFSVGLRLWLSLFLATAFVSVISIFTKISSHAVVCSLLLIWATIMFGIGGALFGVGALMLACWARRALGHHSVLQIVLGIVVGMIAGVCSVLVWP